MKSLNRFYCLFLVVSSFILEGSACVCEPNKVDSLFRCQHVEKCCENELDDPRIDYLRLHYCTFSKAPVLSIILLLAMIVYAFLFLDKIVDAYFTSVMSRLAKLFRLSHNVAGVTFMALGNGASSLVAAASAIQYKTSRSMGISSIVGSSVFVPMVAVGTICFLPNAGLISLTPHVFARDFIFGLIAITVVFVFFLDDKITVVEITIFCLLYGCYLMFALMSELYDRQHPTARPSSSRDRQPLKTSPPDIRYHACDSATPPTRNPTPRRETPPHFAKKNSSSIGSMKASIHQSPLNVDYSQDDRNRRISTPRIDTTHTTVEFESDSMSLDLMSSVSPPISSSVEEYGGNSQIPFHRLVCHYVYKLPVIIFDQLLKLTVPCTSPRRWNDERIIIQTVFAPLFLWFAFHGWGKSIRISSAVAIPTWLIAIFGSFLYTGGVIVAIRLRSRSGRHDEPVWKPFNLFVAFLVAIMWLDLVADELVNICITIGTISGIPLDLMGLTVMVWGNGLDEVLSTRSVARKDLLDMAFGGIFGGVNFIMYMCTIVGVLVAYHGEKHPHGYMAFRMSGGMFLTCVFGMIGYIVMGFWIIVVNRWTVSRNLGIFCVGFYVVFMAFVFVNAVLPFAKSDI